MIEDVAALVGAVTREVRTLERDGRPAKAVIATRLYDTDIEDLWDAVTNPERLPRWFSPVTGDLKLGGKYQVQGNAGGTITACEPPRSFSLTWEFHGAVSWVDVMLTPEGERASLQLTHTAHVEAHWDKFGPGAVGVGWDLGLLGLYLHLKNPGVFKPPEADPEWAASAEAKTFMTLSSQDWAKADIAGGEEEAAARARAELTRKFYCGEA